MEMAEQIAQVLGDENAMNMIRQMAQGLGGSGGGGDLSGLASMLGGGGDLSGLASMLGGGSNDQQSAGNNVGPFASKKQGDPNVELIRALKPFLSGKRRQRAGQAVKIMKMLELAPLLQQSGMLGSLMGGGDDD